MALKLVLEQKPETLLSPAVALSVKPADGTNFQETFFSISDPNNVQVCDMDSVLYLYEVFILLIHHNIYNTLLMIVLVTSFWFTPKERTV